MNCLECTELLHRRLDGEALDAERPALEAHLRDCASCREQFDAARRLQTGIRPFVPPAASPDLTDRIVAACLEPAPSILRIGRWFGSIAAALLVGGLAVWAAFAWLRDEAPGLPAGHLAAPTPPRPAEPAPLNVKEVPSAFAGLARHLTDDVRVLMPQTADLRPPEAPTLEAPTLPMDEVGRTVSEGFKPVTQSFQRAGDMFLRVLPATE